MKDFLKKICDSMFVEIVCLILLIVLCFLVGSGIIPLRFFFALFAGISLVCYFSMVIRETENDRLEKNNILVILFSNKIFTFILFLLFICLFVNVAVHIGFFIFFGAVSYSISKQISDIHRSKLK